MRDFSEISHPLKRDGTSQVDRFQASLDPSGVSLDDRTDADILAFVFQYASQVTYYDEHLQTDDWSDFFKNSIPVQLALISRYKFQQIQNQFDQLFGALEVIPSFEGLNLIIDFVFDLAIQARTWQKALERDYTGFNVLLNNIIRNDLSGALKNVMGIYNAINLNNTITNGKLSVFLNPDQVNQRWQLALPDFLFIRTSIQELKGSEEAKIDTIKHELKKAYLVFFQALERITNESGAFFNRSFSGKEDHEAHLALFYTFLKLFQKSRDQLNTISTRHLDFFFRKNLQIKEKPAIPDQAYLVFEPLPDNLDRLVPEGTLFNAGQDDNGAEIQFAACNDLIVSGAQIESIQTILVDKEPSTTANECGVEEDDTCRIRGIYHAPIANSADGEGLPFENPDTGNWPTLGSAGSTAEESADLAARVGFILASPVLLLQEGTRYIDVEITVKEKAGVGCDCLASLIEADYSDLFCVELSGENGWVKLLSRSTSTPAPDLVPGSEASVRTIIDAVACKITFEINLGTGVEPITFPDPEVLMEEVGTNLPLMRITLNPNLPSETSPYCCLKDLEIQNCCITTTVCGVQDLIVQNENGLLDASTEYAPFGLQPNPGSYFYIGSREIFCKNWEKVQVNLKWDKTAAAIAAIYSNYALSAASITAPPFSNLDHISADLSILQANAWNGSSSEFLFKAFGTGNEQLISKCSTSGDFVQFAFERRDFTVGRFNKEAIFTEFEHWDTSTHKGFIRLAIQDTLNPEYLFFHNAYSAIVQEIAPAIALPPYTPMLKGLTIDYLAKADNDTIDLIHLHPFENGYESISSANGEPLFPQYTDAGHLYIGFNNLQPGDNLHLLFQLAESTTDPYLARAQVNWHYLSNNEWRALRYDLEVLADETLGLTQSGVIQFAIPPDITLGNTILNPSLYWIRASVKDRAAAVAHTISILPHAVKVEFQMGAENDLFRLQEVLPAGSISTPVNNIPGVQGFDQPYDTFGGRPPEVGRSYYIRTSEHLRHKGRGISIFDYERLVLEAFPEIFKVKCISHTLGRNVYQSGSGFLSDDFEMAPGFVTLAVIPDLSSEQIDFSNKLEPKVTAALLERIRLFLKDKTSPFICIRVMNPFYESIKVDVQVKFRKGKSIEFSKAQLNLDIQRFLSPWAFGEPNKIIFGGRIFKSNIVNFIEQLDYVDYIQSFAMSKDGSTVSDVLEASKARSILVSTSDEHSVTSVTETCCIEENSTPLSEDVDGCVGYEKLGSGFLLGND